GRVRDKGLEPRRVQDRRSYRQRVARRARLDDVGAELLAHLRDGVLKRGRGRRRGTLAVELVQDPVGRHDLAAVHEQDGEKHPLSPATESHRTAVAHDFERPEDPELEGHERFLAPARPASQWRCGFGTQLGSGSRALAARTGWAMTTSAHKNMPGGLAVG